MSSYSPPLIVDLDGTLINSDIFFEASLIYLSSNPFRLFQMIYWFITQGRCGLKIQIEKRVSMSIESLPFNPHVIEFLKNEKRKLILVTGCSQKYAEQVSQHLGFISETYGVCLQRPRLTGKNKRKFLVEKYGHKNFDYIGNSLIDIKVWKSAQKCIATNTSALSQKIINFIFPNIQNIKEQKPSALQILKYILLNNKPLLSRIFIFSIPPLIVLTAQNIFEKTLSFKFSISIFFLTTLALFFGFLLVWIVKEIQLLKDYRKKNIRSLFSYFIHPYWSIYILFLFSYFIYLYLIHTGGLIVFIYLFSEYLFSYRKINTMTLVATLWLFSLTTFMI